MVWLVPRSSKIYFAGLARNCEDAIAPNLEALIRIADFRKDCQCFIFLLENDSQDRTGEMLCDFRDKFADRVKLLQLPGLALAKPERIDRLAWCRNSLLEQIRQAVIDPAASLYVPIDLDDQIIASLDPASFWRAVDKIEADGIHGIFPISRPYYYDLLALRAPGWVEADHQELVAESRPRLGWYRSLRQFVFARQLPVSSFAVDTLIPVESAFGGIGIYRFGAIASSRYQINWLGHCFECEHVSFNRGLNNLYIDTDFVVQAPAGHIAYQLMGDWQRLRFRIVCALKDLIRGLAANRRR